MKPKNKYDFELKEAMEKLLTRLNRDKHHYVNRNGGLNSRGIGVKFQYDRILREMNKRNISQGYKPFEDIVL